MEGLFNTVFNSEEQGTLIESELTDSTSSDVNDTTIDKVFLLSRDEVMKYMPHEEVVAAQHTPYFYMQYFNYMNMGGDISGCKKYGYAGWRLRNAGNNEYNKPTTFLLVWLFYWYNLKMA